MYSYALYVARLESNKSHPNVKKVTVVLVDQEGSQNETFHKDIVEVLPSFYHDVIMPDIVRMVMLFFVLPMFNTS